MPLSLLWLLVWIFQYQGINQEIAEKSQSKGEACLVSSQDWQSEIELVKSGGNSTKTQYTPFEGRKSDQPYFKGNHGDLRALEVQVLQKDIKGVCKWLQPVPDTMAGVSGHRIRPSYPSTGLELEVPSRVGPKSTQPTQWQGQQRQVAATEIASTWTQRSREGRWIQSWQGRWQSPAGKADWKGKSPKPEHGQRQGQGGNYGASGASMDSDIASKQFTIAATDNATATALGGRNYIEGIDPCAEKITARHGPRGASHFTTITHERRAEINSIPLQCSGRFEHSTRDTGHCKASQAQSPHQVAQFPDRCGPEMAEAHGGFSERRIRTDTTDRGCQDLTSCCSSKIRELKVGTGCAGHRCRSPSRHGRGCGRWFRRSDSRNCTIRQFGDHAFAIRDSASFSRSNGNRRGKQLQQTAACRRRICAISAIIWWGNAITLSTSHASIPETGVQGEPRFAFAFSTARQVVTEVYPCLGHPCVLNWTHSACDEPWFTTKWYAIESAYELAWKLGTPPSNVSDHQERQLSACGKSRHVCFSSDVDIRFTLETPSISATLVVAESRLHNWTEKPWSLHSSEPSAFSDCIEKAATQVTNSKSLQTQDFHGLQRTPLKSIENILDSDSFKYERHRLEAQEPLSNEAVSIRTSLPAEKDTTQQPRLWKCHRSDEFYNVPSRWYGHTDNDDHNDRNENNDQEQPNDDAGFFLHEAPDSIQLLFDAFLREGLIIGPGLEESVFVRSWHIHHIHEPRCWHHRTLELQGHWRHWFNDILAGWRDKNDPNEDTIFSIVHPNPPRSGMTQEIIFDIIISQGLEAPRNSGLITVLQKNDRASRARFSLAASLPYTTSGVQIVQGAEIVHECNRDICTIRHAGITIPFTMAPTHDVQDGDSFTIAIIAGCQQLIDTGSPMSGGWSE